MFDSIWTYVLSGAIAYTLLVKYIITPRTKIVDYDKKHVLITGGSAGLGKSLAIKFAKLGANVTIIARDPKKLDEAVKELNVKIFA